MAFSDKVIGTRPEAVHLLVELQVVSTRFSPVYEMGILRNRHTVAPAPVMLAALYLLGLAGHELMLTKNGREYRCLTGEHRLLV
ncbi:hypothetical protein RJ640_003750 [Escallonia rubra]|uniref:Uncharacterized protein n=1 Tax=Escallonia rubra TaxID=112253 RepID=A0AA88SBW1_9ASTE|nr:hypothetical protein RJ640_003750 [Escallonia rubra]